MIANFGIPSFPFSDILDLMLEKRHFPNDEMEQKLSIFFIASLPMANSRCNGYRVRILLWIQYTFLIDGASPTSTGNCKWNTSWQYDYGGYYSIIWYVNLQLRGYSWEAEYEKKVLVTYGRIHQRCLQLLWLFFLEIEKQTFSDLLVLVLSFIKEGVALGSLKPTPV